MHVAMMTLKGLPIGFEPGGKGFDDGVAALRGKRRHVTRGACAGSSSSRRSLAVALSRLLVEGSNSSECADLLTNGLAEFTEVGKQRTRSAIYVGNNTLTLNGCSFTANASNYYGGALFVTGGSNPGRVNLQSTRICGNTAPNGPQIGMTTGAIVNMDAYSCVSNACKNCTVALPCPADLNLDRVVNAADLSVMLSDWGSCKSNCPGDLNTDGVVDAADLSVMLSTWGACPG